MAESKTLRLLMPQWQGGDYDLSSPSGKLYPLGAELLEFLAPRSAAETVEVPVAPFDPSKKRHKENGVVNQEEVIRQVKAAAEILEEKKPDRVVVFGGECLVSQAPFDYLNGRYEGELGVIWIDAHPDISTPANQDREHAMVLGNLLGGGDPEMRKEVKHPLKPEQVLLIGMDGFDSPKEEATIANLGLKIINPREIGPDFSKIVKWLEFNKIKNAAIHFDVDALNPKKFFSQLTNDPYAEETFPTVRGQLDLNQVGAIIKTIAEHANIVGLTIAEFMPWDALHLKKFMAGLEIMR